MDYDYNHQVKVTKAKSEANRAALVKAAATMFREHGIDGVGVVDVSRAAGLTHGALYSLFGSKAELAAAAFTAGFEQAHAAMANARPDDADLGTYLDFLLSRRARDRMSVGCPLTASGSEVARQDLAVGVAFAEGFERLVEGIEPLLDDAPFDATSRERALSIIAGEIGAVIVARAIARARPKLSDDVLAAARNVFGAVGGESKTGSA